LFGPTELLAPITPQEFLTGYWEKRVCHIGGRAPEYYSGVFSIADVDASLLPVRQAVAEPVARPVKHRKSESAEDTGSLYQSFLEGSTINVNFIDRQFPALNRLCRTMEQLFHFPSGANLYLTPPKSQGFSAHYDTHDVFVLQISGEKRWDIWAPTYSLPLRESNQPVPRDLAGPAESILLKPGDLLYLPRGFIHQAYTENEVTLHVTVRVEPLRWLDLAIAALKLTAEQTPALREALPPGFLHDTNLSKTARNHLRDLLGPLVQDSDILAGVTVLGKELTSKLFPLLDNRFETLGAIGSLSQASVLRKRDGTVSFLESANGRLNLYFGGNLTSVPQRVSPALEFIIANDTFTVEAIPGLDESSRLVLARRLVKAGYLTTSS
jgi:ribosomal protein L16 Arg81 hydroxylase